MSTTAKFKYNYSAYIFYTCALFLMVLLNNIGLKGDIFSLAILYALLCGGYNIAANFVVFNLSFIFSMDMSVSFGAIIASSALTFPFILYKIFKKKPRFETIIFAAVATLHYVLTPDTADIIRRTISAGITVCLSQISYVALMAGANKLFRCRLKPDELVCLAALYTAAALGFINLFGIDAYKALSIFLILIFCKITAGFNGMFFAANLALPLAILEKSLSSIGLFCIFAFFSLLFMKHSRVLAAVSLMVVEVCAAYYFNFYATYGTINLIYASAGALLFVVIPQPLIEKLSKVSSAYREKYLVRNAINRSRMTVANKLYEISGVFKDLESVFAQVRTSFINEDTAIKCVVSEVNENVCKNCENYNRCDNDEVLKGLVKLTRVGLSKGKVNIIDMPSDISINCSRPNNILYAVNKLLSDYRAHILEAKNSDEGRDMIARQASGVCEILKGLALETGKVLNFESNLEQRLSHTFLSSGIVVFEVLIYGDGEDITVNAVLAPDVPSKLISKIVTDIVGKNMTISEKIMVSKNKCAYMFKNTPPLDAVFGVAMAAKDGSSKSGDTYSVIRISEQKFLVALSDGMGSGDDAHSLSSAAIMLIEGFFKTGMPTDLVLSTVNKVLNFNREENYACLDIALIDLISGNTGVIKIGSPFGFIIRDGEIKILESDSLPLGILDQLKPVIKKEQLNPDDLLLLISDGISLAFGSSTDMFEFLQNCPSKNPQVLCDTILKEAISLCGGKAEDDMTVIATRIFLKSA